MKRIVTFLLAMIAASTAFGGEKLLPVEWCRSLPIITLSADDPSGRQLRLILDTGSSGSWIDPDSFERFAGRRPEGDATIRDLSAGPLKISWISFGIHKIDDLQRTLDSPVDGILGYHVFSEMVLVLDGPGAQIRVSSEPLPPASGRNVMAMARFKGSRPFIKVKVSGKTRKLLIDSGATGPFGLPKASRPHWRDSRSETSLSSVTGDRSSTIPVVRITSQLGTRQFSR
ncbi:hypothetical protein DRQ50_14330 [bacterium]|nr:MAG: hypothetical protein DRQ50_14330 [bacterium]